MKIKFYLIFFAILLTMSSLSFSREQAGSIKNSTSNISHPSSSKKYWYCGKYSSSKGCETASNQIRICYGDGSGCWITVKD